MNKLSGGKNTTVLLVVVLMMTLLFAVYYYLVMPKQDEVTSMQSSVTSIQSNVASLKEQISAAKATQEVEVVDEYVLHKKVPQSRYVDKLLLNIEEIDYVAGTRVQSISFNNYDSLVSGSGLQDPNYIPPVEGEEVEIEPTTEEASKEEQSMTPVSLIASETLPAELKLLTLSVSLEAPDYDALLAFIKEVESLERVVRVDTISYSLAGEELDYDPEVSTIVSATVQVTTFYYEGN